MAGRLAELAPAGITINEGTSNEKNVYITDNVENLEGGLFPDGKRRWAEPYGQDDEGLTWKQRCVSYGSSGPTWGEPATLATIAKLEGADPHPGGGADRTGVLTSGGVLVAYGTIGYDGSGGEGWRLGGVSASSGSAWRWKASHTTVPTYESWSAPFDADLWPTDGSYPAILGTENPNAGGALMSTGHNIFYGYRGNFYEIMYRHYFDDGLFVGEFGAGWNYTPGQEGLAGNTANQWLVQLPDGPAFIYSTDESYHGGVHRWRIEGLDTVEEHDTSVTVEDDTWSGLYAEYFDTADWNNFNLVTTRVDGQVSAAAEDTALTDGETFSVRWTGYVVPTHSEDYTFTIEADDVARVWVDGRLVDTSDGSSTAVELAEGVRYPIRVEYKHGTGTASVSLKWSSLSVPEEEVPQAQLLAVLPGVDLMSGLPGSGPLTNGTAGWNRYPTSDSGDYWHPWHVTIEQNDGNPYLHVVFGDIDSGKNYYVTRDLGTANSDTKTWDVNMNVSYQDTYPNLDPYCGQRLELLDDADKVIAQFYLTQSPSEGQIYANGKYIDHGSLWTVTTSMYPWQPLRISARDGQITFKYGSHPPVSAAEKDPTADWRRIKKLRLAFYTATSGCFYGDVVNIDGLRISRSTDDASVDLLAGIPSATATDGWIEAGDYGWLKSTLSSPPSGSIWSAKTDNLEWRAGPPTDLGVMFATSATNATVTVKRDLGTPNDATVAWTLSGLVNYRNSLPNNSNTSSYLDVLDDSSNVIARLQAAGTQLQGNGGSLITSRTFATMNELRGFTSVWRPLEISAAISRDVTNDADICELTFRYAGESAVTRSPVSGSSCRRPKELRGTFKTGGVEEWWPTGINFMDMKLSKSDVTSGLALWLRADQLSGTNNSAVSSWPDQSGNGHTAVQLTSSKQPVLHTGSNGLNGLNVVTFDGVDDFLETSFHVGPSGMTIFYVARTGSSVPTYQIVLGSGGPKSTSGVWWGVGLGANSTYGAGWAGTGTVQLGGVSGSAANTAYFARYRTNKSAWSIDGVNSGTPSDTTFPMGLFNAFVGADDDDTWKYSFKGDIAEIRVYNAALSDSECATIKSEMKTRWGLP